MARSCSEKAPASNGIGKWRERRRPTGEREQEKTNLFSSFRPVRHFFLARLREHTRADSLRPTPAIYSYRMSFPPLLLLLLSLLPPRCLCNLDEWWTYDGISGPAYWGVINPSWSLCSRGRRQSPIDVDPARLVFDRTLRPLSVDKKLLEG